MDLKSFGEPDFDPKQWINRAWKASKEKESKEVFVANTLGKLQLYMQQLNISLEDTSTQLVSGLPRVLSEAQALQQDGVALRHKLQGLQSQVCAVEEATGQSIRSLQRIDSLKGKLENAASSLREADKWVQLATALEDKLEAGVPTQGPQLVELTQQIQAMTNSLEVLSDAPDYNEKKQQLEGLYNRLEAALSPSVVDAFTNHNTESARASALTFSHMRRGASLRGYWRRCETTRLAGSWSRMLEPGVRAAAVLRELHGSMLRHAGHQLEWCTEVFGGDLVLPDLVQLYTELLQSLQPSPSEVVTAGLKQLENPADALEALSDVRAACRHFVDGFVAVIEGVRGRKDSASISPSSLTQLGRAVYAPLRNQLPRYAELQAQALAFQLNSINAGQEDALERARALLVGAERSSSWLLASLAVGQKLAGAACVPHLLAAFESFISLHCSRLRANRRQLEAALNAARATAGPTTERLWLMFPPALLLLCTAGVLLDAVKVLQAAVADALFVDSAKLSRPPLHDDEALLLEPDSARQLELQRLSTAPLEQSSSDLRRVCRDLRGTALQVVFEPVAELLDKLPEMDTWNENGNDAASDADLPEFSFSPQEYITQIGQYLMTLPQHLEPFLAEQRHGAALAASLAAAGDQVGTDSDQAVSGADLAWYFLNEICSSTCELYCDKILSIRYMDAMGSRRYATDIAYVCSIVEELGSPSAAALRKLEKLLRASPATFSEAAEGVSARVAATVKHLRGFGNQ